MSNVQCQENTLGPSDQSGGLDTGADQPRIINTGVLTAYAKCRYKAFLLLDGQTGPKSAYERALNELRDGVRLKAFVRMTSQAAPCDVRRHVIVTRSILQEAVPFILHCEFVTDGFCLRVDGFQKVSGHSNLGAYRYEPLLFHESYRIREEQRLVLAAIAILLSRIQGAVPTRGVIFHGSEGSRSTVRLSPALIKAATRFVDDLNRLRRREVQPNLILNDHCQVCEFQHQCRNQARKQESLSLLRGLSAREIGAYRRKGILTLTQLAHTFRPKRDGKRLGREHRRRYYALQALAIRDHRVYVLGTPKLPTGAVQIYLDFEGSPQNEYIYLIGMIIEDGDQEHVHSLWADSKADERPIFEQFLAVVARYTNPVIYCYGDYERAFMSRLRNVARRKKSVDKAIDALVNVLSLVYAHFYFPTYSNGLKEIGAFLGCRWTENDASSAHSIAWRIWWESTRDDTWKAKLIQYNREDCAALRKLAHFLEAAAAHTSSSAVPAIPDAAGPSVSHVRELDRLVSRDRWARNKFANPDLKLVNDCAYFDYQRQRVFVRTNKALKQQVRRSGVQHNRTLRGTDILVSASKCRTCGGTDLVPVILSLKIL